MPQAKPKIKTLRQSCRDHLRAITPLPSPRDLFESLERLGYRGQAGARRSAALFAYRHIRRLQRIYVEGVPRSKLPPKSNMLLIGPTGCGKTYLVELLFERIFQLPHVVVDVSRLTESGYVGSDASTVLTRLLIAAKGDLAAAQMGIVVLDEIDKIALQTSSARFSGQGTTKDVKGNVQKELLQIIGGAKVNVSTALGETTFAPQIIMNTRDIGFVGAGAFSGFKELAVAREGNRFGFHGGQSPPADTVAYELSENEVIDVDLFHSYGFLPEFIARFGQMCRLHPLARAELRQILEDNVLPPLQEEFALEGVPLKLTRRQLDRFIDEAVSRRTGARALRSVVDRHVEQVAFERFGGGSAAS